ncbi:MAG: hypothetical protein JKY95_01270 [Planctomycetaceae bacterium]|nr:hypothetical protein [Planctomycetaceae bacterium]
MAASSNVLNEKKKYHRNAYEFLFEALRYTQETLDRGVVVEGVNEDSAHISGKELLEGVRLLAIEKFGLLTQTVFRYWGVDSTEDFGRIVFDLIERGEMRKTERDQLCDFVDIYDFQKAFDEDYEIDIREAFKIR